MMNKFLAFLLLLLTQKPCLGRLSTTFTSTEPNSDLGDHQLEIGDEEEEVPKGGVPLEESSAQDPNFRQFRRDLRSEAELTYTLENARTDIEYLCENYFNHPNYLEIDGKPVLFVYLTRKLEALDLLEKVVDMMRSVHCNGLEIFLVGDHSFSSPTHTPGETYEPFVLLDAITNYDVYGSIQGRDQVLYPGEKIQEHYDRQKQWRDAAMSHAGDSTCGFIPSVSPGYNDLGVRFNKQNTPMARRLDPDADPGSLFRLAIDTAKTMVDPGSKNILMVNSFNEWHEDTQIEPAVGISTNQPLDMTQGLEYEGYGELYLDILRNGTTSWTENLFLHTTPIAPTTSFSPAEVDLCMNDEEREALFPPHPSEVQRPDSSTDIMVGVYYYPWHADDFHRGQGYLREKLGQCPTLGEYDDSDPVTIERHLSWSKQANIGLWVSSWWGPGSREDETLLNSILPLPELGDHKVALFYETTSRILKDPCKGCNESCLRLSIRTDSKPKQTRVNLWDADSGKLLHQTKYKDYPLANTLYSETLCYPNTCFEFQIQDKGKNGFQNGGYYSLAANGEIFVNQHSDFGKFEKIEFCAPTPAPTISPAPTLVPTPAPTLVPTTPAPTLAARGCEDADSFEDSKGKTRTCSWVASKKKKRCKEFSDYCPVTCETCQAEPPTEPPTEPPADAPMDTPTEPPVHPTPAPNCEDADTFQDNGTTRTCSWVALKRFRRCKKFGDYCPVTCERCPTEAPQVNPTPAPVSPPTPAPANPTQACDDEDTFQDNRGRPRTCSWVAQLLVKRCQKFGDHCPVTCDLCETDNEN